MNRQKFLAELRRLLVYMTEEDREEAIRRVEALFDSAGADGEEGVIAQLGTPTRTAIALSRRYEPGAIPDALPHSVPVKAPAPPAMPKAPAEEPDALWSDLPDFDPPAVEDEAEPSPAEESSPAEPETPEFVRENAKAPESPGEPVYAVERTMPLGLGVPLFVLVFAALGLPLAALAVALCLAFLVPGGGVLAGAYLALVGGLWCTGYLADAALLFGLAAVILAVGLLLLYLGVWAAVRLWQTYVRGLGWIAGELLGRRVAVDA